MPFLKENAYKSAKVYSKQNYAETINNLYKSILENYFTDKSFVISYLSTVEKIFLSYIESKSLDEKINNLLNSISSKKMLKYILIIEEELSKLEYNLNLKLWLDRFYSRLIEVYYD